VATSDAVWLNEDRRRSGTLGSTGQPDPVENLPHPGPGRPGRLAVGRLQERLKIPASTLSHHVKALVAVGLITQVRESTTLVCHAEYATMRGLVDFLAAECCADETECKEAARPAA
jgi:DNA-binding transcriptional ArsR family regulator